MYDFTHQLSTQDNRSAKLKQESVQHLLKLIKREK